MNTINRIDDPLRLKIIAYILENKYIIFGLILYGVMIPRWMNNASMFDIGFMHSTLSLDYLLTAFTTFIFLGDNASRMQLSIDGAGG